MFEGIEKIIHRGKINKETPPNSLDSLLENYQGAVETDVVLLRDGNIVIGHPRDFNLADNEMENMGLEEIEKFTIPAEIKNYAGKAPLLEEYIGLAVDADVALDLDIKASSSEKAEELVEKIINKIIKMRDQGAFVGNEKFLSEKIIFDSMSISALKKAQELSRDSGIGAAQVLAWPTSAEWAEKIPSFDHEALKEMPNRDQLSWSELGVEAARINGFRFINLHTKIIDQNIINYAHDKNVEIVAWGAKTQEQLDELKKMGVDRFIV